MTAPIPLRADPVALRQAERRSFMRAAAAALQLRLFLSVCRRTVGIEREPAVFRPSAGRRGLSEVPI